MKKLLLTAAISISGLLTVSAQSPVVYTPFDKPADQELKFPKSNKAHNKLDISEWYDHIQMIEKSNVGASLQSFVDLMYHDTLSKRVTADGTLDYSWGRSSIGHVFDPKDDLIGQTDNPVAKLSKFVSYTMDSLAFTYLYVRNVDSLADGLGGKLPVVDTLFVSYFKGAQIRKAGVQGRPTKLALVDWVGGNVRFPTNYVKTDTILLTAADSTIVLNNNNGFENSWRLKVMNLKAPSALMEVDAQNGVNENNLVAAALTFKSGVKSVIGTDTAIAIYNMDTLTFPSGARRTNYFGGRIFQNQGTTVWNNETFYNTSMFTGIPHAYVTTNGWNGYIAGTAFRGANNTPGDLFLQIFFKLTTTSNNVGISEIKNDVFALSNVYPNPARSTEKSVIAFNLKESATVNVSIMNLMGQEVKNLFTQSFADGAHAEFLDLSGLKPGVYMVNMTVNGSTVSKKLSVTE